MTDQPDGLRTKLAFDRGSQKNLYYGELAERSKAAVLKTVDVKASWGSNPYLPATFYRLKLSNIFRLFLFDFKRNS